MPCIYNAPGCECVRHDTSEWTWFATLTLPMRAAEWEPMPETATWFATLGITNVEHYSDEWFVALVTDAPFRLHCWVAGDGIAREHHLPYREEGQPHIPEPTAWLEESKPTFTLAAPPAFDPRPLPIAPPRSRDVRGESDDAEPTCEDCNEAEENCECVTCDAPRCTRRGPIDTVGHCEVCERCDECCQCVVCNHRRCEWRGPEADRCDCCERCSDHCECSYCDSCDTRTRNGMCRECDRCGDCCEGHDSGEHPEWVDYPLTFHPAMRGEHKRNPTKRHIGVEVEVAEMDGDGFDDIQDVCRRWRASITEDGSLPESGFEIPTAPASGDKFCEQVEEICGTLRDHGGKITGACGLHVHVDARDFRHYDMRRLVMLYAKLESALFATQPESRAASGYCDPCGPRYTAGLKTARTAKASKHTLMGNVYEGAGNRQEYGTVTEGRYDSRKVKQVKYSTVRYHALNLHSWVLRGTIECRLHTGSIEPSKIIPWGILWAAILDHAMKTPEATLDALTFATMGEAQAYLHDVIAPTTEVKDYLRARWAKFGNAYEPVASEYALAEGA